MTELQTAAALRDAGQLREAIALYLNIINAAADEPKTAPVYELLGDALREQNDVARALESYRRAVNLKPTAQNRQKYDDMIDASRGKAPQPRPTPPTPMLDAYAQKPLEEEQTSLEAVQPIRDDNEEPIDEEPQLVITSLRRDDETPQPVKATLLQGMSTPAAVYEPVLPAGETPLPVVNLPCLMNEGDADSNDTGHFFASSALNADLRARNRAFLLLGAAGLAVIASVLFTLQPWSHPPLPTSHKTPISLARISVAPLPPALGSASGSGFSLLSQKPPTKGAPMKEQN